MSRGGVFSPALPNRSTTKAGRHQLAPLLPHLVEELPAGKDHVEAALRKLLDGRLNVSIKDLQAYGDAACVSVKERLTDCWGISWFP